jgi:propionaldehyde dehydrogenase
METGKEIMRHRDIRILVVTGGEAVVHLAMTSGKKVIAAGPGNPPCIVDDTANIARAANDIVRGASFDNNILCVAEKEVFVFSSVADRLVSELTINHCFRATPEHVDTIEKVVLERCPRTGQPVPNKRFVGKDARLILEECRIATGDDYRLIIAEVDFSHPFVHTEMLMPVLPIVRVRSLEEAVDKAVAAERGCFHTAIMHSQNVSHLTYAARRLNTTIFVKNAPSFAGLGIEGEGFTTLTIATPTGEGLTSARTFTRRRRCVLSGAFRIV